MYPKVSIIILNWNGMEDTTECLESLKQIVYPNYEILLVDNGSIDGSVNYFMRHYPGIEIIENRDNLGFAEGNNVGIRRALDKGTDYILILNNDTVVDKEFLGELVNVAESDSKIGLVQSKLLYYDNKSINNTGLFLDVFGASIQRGRFERDSGQYDHLMDTGYFYLSGACLLISKILVSELKGDVFDKSLFAYHEDVDLSWMAKLLGFRIIYCPTSICYHKEGKSSGGFNKKRAYWEYRNRIRVLMKNYSMKNLIIFLPITILLELTTSCIISFHRNDFGYLISFVKGIIWNIKNLKSTIKMRSFIQLKRKVTDREIMKKMEWNSIECQYFMGKLYHYYKFHVHNKYQIPH